MSRTYCSLHSFSRKSRAKSRSICCSSVRPRSIKPPLCPGFRRPATSQPSCAQCKVPPPSGSTSYSDVSSKKTENREQLRFTLRSIAEAREAALPSFTVGEDGFMREGMLPVDAGERDSLTYDAHEMLIKAY